MTMTRVDLEHELRREQKKTPAGILDEARELLRQTALDEADIEERIHHGNEGHWNVDPSGLDGTRIFSRNSIRTICTRYRLRFLPATHFKGKIPYEAIRKVRQLEADTGVRIERFRIMAPDERFELEDATKDPLLFAPLGNGQFYLIHKWGGDMSVFRRVGYFPFRNARTLFLTCVFLAFILALLVPGSWLGGESLTTNLAVLKKAFTGFIFSIFFFTSALIFGITTSREFSSEQWNSKFFN